MRLKVAECRSFFVFVAAEINYAIKLWNWMLHIIFLNCFGFPKCVYLKVFKHRIFTRTHSSINVVMLTKCFVVRSNTLLLQSTYPFHIYSTFNFIFCCFDYLNWHCVMYPTRNTVLMERQSIIDSTINKIKRQWPLQIVAWLGIISVFKNVQNFKQNCMFEKYYRFDARHTYIFWRDRVFLRVLGFFSNLFLLWAWRQNSGILQSTNTWLGQSWKYAA